ncbi:MAG TPA: N-acyl homoserine lactonase family protein [Nakamurella sp.]|jgi:glyoxylase-like metal-dependent hydrolase (beta-lactamase superfamily II)|nr:N-acyl homoserine lactonase family protein [Nakamurella sp.]
MTSAEVSAQSQADPIEDVAVISTGTVMIRPEHVGPTNKNLYYWLFTSRRWTTPKPINAYVIKHREGVVLFDTGQDRASVTDPDYFPRGLTGLVYSRLAKFEIGPTDTLVAGLRGLGVEPSDVHTAALSHLHQDHIGALPYLGSGPRVAIARDEWESLGAPLPAARGLMRNHIDLPGLRWQRFDPEPLGDPFLDPFTHGHDVFQDGSIVLLPTPGHTPGSISMLVRRPHHAPLLMVGDLTYDDDLLRAGSLPGVGDKQVMRKSASRVNRLRAALPGLAVLPAHDPGAADRLRRAMEGVPSRTPAAAPTAQPGAAS